MKKVSILLIAVFGFAVMSCGGGSNEPAEVPQLNEEEQAELDDASEDLLNDIGDDMSEDDTDSTATEGGEEMDADSASAE